MVTKSKKHLPQAKTELRVNTTRNSGKQKKEKKQKSKKHARKEKSPMKSIKKSLRNQFQKIKGNGGKKQESVPNISNVTSSMASDLEDLVSHSPQGLSSPKVTAKELTLTTGKKRSSVSSKGKKGPSSTKVREVPTSKGKKELPIQQKSLRKDPRIRQKKEKSHRRSKTVENDANLKCGYEMKKVSKKRLSGKRESRDQRNDFRSYSVSTDYSDSDFHGEYRTDASSAYSANSYHDSESESESGSDSDSDFSGSDSSSSYTTEEDGFTMRTERSVLNRNPEAKRGRSRNSRQKQSKSTAPIRSPRSSPKKSSSHHIRSPQRSGRSHNAKRFFPEDSIDVSNSDSYVTGTSYDDGESESDSETSKSISDSCYSDSESEDESETNDEYYTTSYDESRHLHDSSYSTSWTDRPVSTYGSEETERTSFTNQKRQDHYPTLLGDPSGTDDSHRYGSRSTMGDSRDLGSIDEKEYSEFVKEQEAAEKIEKERAAAVEKKKKELELELEEAQKRKEQQTSSSGGMFSWIFGVSSANTEPTLETKTEKVDENEEGEAHKGESGIKDDHVTELKPPVQTKKEDETGQIISSPMNSQRSTLSPRSPRPSLLPLSPQSQQSLPLSPRTQRSAASSSRNDFIIRDRRSAIFLEDDYSNRAGDQPDGVDPAMSPGCSVNLREILGRDDSMPESYGGLKEGEFLLSNLGSDSVDKAETNGEAMSFTMRGSATFENSNFLSPTGALQEIAFSPQSPSVMSSPTRSRRVGSYFPEEREGDDDFLYYCCPSEHGTRLDQLPASGTADKQFIRLVTTGNEGTAYNANDDVISALVDDTTCASTINTEGFQDIKDAQVVKPSSEPAVSQSSSHEVVNEEKNAQYFMIPAKSEEYEDEDDKVSSSAEEIEIELHDNADKVSSSAEEIEIELHDDVVSPPSDGEIEHEDQETTKRIKAECLDDYEISEILHGKRSYKSKTDEDGVPIPVSRPSTPTGRRERRQNALKAHRDFLYKSYSIDTNVDAPKECADNTDERSRSDSDQAIYGDEGNKTSTGEDKTSSGDTSTEGHSILSNSIVQDDSVIPNDAEKPDALMELVRNAFNVMMSPTNDRTTAPDAPANAASSPSGPMDDVLEVALRFFAPPKETPRIISETQRGEMESLKIINFDPNPGVRKAESQVKRTDKAIEKEFDDSSKMYSKQAHLEEGSSSSLDITNASDEAVLRKSRSKTSIHKHDVVLDASRFNADGIPLELRPKKIWRAFDSGFSVSPSTNGQSIISAETENDASIIPESKFNNNQDSEILPEVVLNSMGQNEVEADSNQNDGINDQLDSIIDKHEKDDQNKNEVGAPEHGQNLEISQQPQPQPQPQPDMKSETKETKEECGLRLSSSTRYRRRSEMKRLKSRRLHQEKTLKEYCPESTDGHRGTSSSLSPRKEQRESFEKNLIRSSLSPTKRQLGVFKHDRPQSKSCSNISAINQGSEEPLPEIVAEERSDDTMINDQQGEEPRSDRAPPSPITTSVDKTIDKANVSSSVSPQKNNISDIRSRIKQRRRSNFRKQQQQQQQQQQVVATKKGAQKIASNPQKEDVQQDRREDSFTTKDNEDEQFFDAVNFDDNNDDEEESSTEIEVVSPAAKYLSAPDFDQSYPVLSDKESILSAVMSLD